MKVKLLVVMFLLFKLYFRFGLIINESDIDDDFGIEVKIFDVIDKVVVV